MHPHEYNRAPPTRTEPSPLAQTVVAILWTLGLACMVFGVVALLCYLPI